MRIEVELQRLNQIFNILSMGKKILEVDIKVENGLLKFENIFNENIYQIAVFKTSFFKKISGSCSFKVNIKKILKYLIHLSKVYSKHQLIILELIDNKLLLSIGNCNGSFDVMSYKCIERPFSFNNGVPVVSDGSRLDIQLSLQLSDLKRLSNRIKKDDILSLILKDGKLSIQVWKPNDEYAGIFTRYPSYYIKNGEDFNASFDMNIRNVFKIFSKKIINVYTKSGQHVWLTEETEDYSVGFMVCPIET
jgi:hypothetical protein